MVPTKETSLLSSKWRLSGNTHAVFIQMGKNGVGILEKIFNQLHSESKHTIAAKYYFICGTNGALRDKFTQKLQSPETSNSALAQAEIHGLVTHQDVISRCLFLYSSSLR